ncbi:MAG: hypothetical protein FJZ11_07165, partial [Candidatus Omnitrophica bacterium]|nr:hypothetical protein [Candidatus Omnitrophota bacterium]
CREQGIPAVTAVGKIIIDGHLLKTGDGLTVDANNGRIFKLQHKIKTDKGDFEFRHIPIKFVKFRIKPYGIPGYKHSGKAVDEDGFPIPTIGLIIAATSAAQENTAIMLAPDSSGNALTRAEFEGEALGVNVFGGYGYDLIQDIKSGKISRPERIYIEDLLQGKVKGAKKFIDKVNDEIYRHLKKHPEALKIFEQLAGYRKQDGMRLLAGFDFLRDMATGKLDKDRLTSQQIKSLAFINQIRAYERDLLAYLYGVMQRRYNYDYNIIEELESHPWLIEEVAEKLKEKGYSTFKEYAGKDFYYFYNLMGFTIAPDQKAKNRAYDFAQDKVRGLISSEIFSWPGINPLVGLRGTSLEIEGVDDESLGNQKVLSFLLEAVIDADANTHNQAWFYVFVRFSREMEMLDKVLGMIAERKGKLVKQIGIMIEVPSDAILTRKLRNSLLAMKKKYAKYGVEKVFFSFGTNDYSHLASKADREDPRMKLKILDPLGIKAIDEIKKEGYFYDDATGKLPLVDEGADTMIQLIEAVVAVANEPDLESTEELLEELGVETS